MPSLNANANTSLRRFFDARYVGWALAAAAVDLFSKQVAASLLGNSEVLFTQRFGLLLVFNTGGAGGYSIGPATWYLNVFVTAAAILIMSVIAADLSRFHKLGALSLGLVAGGAIGNLASMLSGPAGVADFLALHFEDRSIIFNFADVSLWTGALMLIPVVLSLARAIRTEREEKRGKRVATAAF
jgi:lipoprotein signal peptidase